LNLDDKEKIEFDKIADEMEKSLRTKRTSSNLLLFHVEDILGLAQIKSGNFQKNFGIVDIR
jgi:hypothetical protein